MDIHPCPPPPSRPCPQICPPEPCPPPRRPKPEMRGMHWKQTKGNIFKALLVSFLAGQTYRILVAKPRKEAYLEYYKRSDFDEQADEMARKGLFNSCPKGS